MFQQISTDEYKKSTPKNIHHRKQLITQPQVRPINWYIKNLRQKAF